MAEHLIFTIPDMDELVDCFRAPMAERTFEPDAQGIIRGWPSFHVSQADPDGKYREYTYAIRFHMEKAEDAALHIGVIASTPRLPFIRLTVNGHKGCIYPFPAPSRDKEVRPRHALHAAIYNRDDVMAYIPAGLLHAGENVLAITAVDDLPELMVHNAEAVLRLDRMADACGWHYGALELLAGVKAQCSARVRPSVLFKEIDGSLCERVDVTLTPAAGVDEIAGKMVLTWDGGEKTVAYQFQANAFGQYTFSCWLPDGTGQVHCAISGAVTHEEVFHRSRKWNVHITPHAHTDIGYTHRQMEVAERMSRNLDAAIETMHRTEDFSYILDSAWSADDYLATRGPEKREALFQLVRQGRIGIPANYVDLLTQTASLEDLIHNGDFSENLLGPEGLVADRVDMVDVASATSAYPTILAGMGVKWMMHANNQDRGPFRFNGNMHRKAPFWWEGPDGSRILVWLSRMYCELKKVCGSPGSVPAAERGLEMWLQDYEREDYKPDTIVLYGMEADNTDIDVRMADFIGAWKRAYAYPKLIPSNGSAFFEHVMAWADSFPVYRGDEGGWWEDGVASSFKESAALRDAQASLKCAESLESIAALTSGGSFPREQYDQAWKQIVLFDEHTWGSFMSQQDPHSMLQEDAWAFKKHLSDDAWNRTNSLVTRSASRISLLWNNAGREIVIYNPYSFPVTGYAETEIASSETICDQAGNEIIWRENGSSASQKRVLVPVKGLPGYSCVRYTLRPRQNSDHAGSVGSAPAQPRSVLENAFYRVVVDTESGVVRSVWDKELRREICKRPMGELLYAMGGDGSMLRGNHAGLRRDGATVVHGFMPRTAVLESSLVDTRVVLEGQAFRGSAKMTITLPADRKELLFQYEYDKEATPSPEAVYVRFPFDVPDDTPVLSDSHIGWVDWQKDVIPGVCREWLPLQTSIMVKAKDMHIQLASPDAFLFTVNSPVMGKWSSELNVRGGDIYSFVLNNYWHTNYLGEQGGRFVFRYALTTASSIRPEEAFRYGWSKRRATVAQRMSYQEFRHDVPAHLLDASGSVLMKAESDHIVVNTIRAAKKERGAYLFRLLETGGRAGEISLSMPGRKVTALQDVDHLERPMGEKHIPCAIQLAPWQLRSVLVWFE